MPRLALPALALLAALAATAPGVPAAPLEFHSVTDHSHGQPPYNGSPVRRIGRFTVNEAQDLLTGGSFPEVDSGIGTSRREPFAVRRECERADLVRRFHSEQLVTLCLLHRVVRQTLFLHAGVAIAERQAAPLRDCQTAPVRGEGKGGQLAQTIG